MNLLELGALGEFLGSIVVLITLSMSIATADRKQTSIVRRPYAITSSGAPYFHFGRTRRSIPTTMNKPVHKMSTRPSNDNPSVVSRPLTSCRSSKARPDTGVFVH